MTWRACSFWYSPRNVWYVSWKPLVIHIWYLQSTIISISCVFCSSTRPTQFDSARTRTRNFTSCSDSSHQYSPNDNDSKLHNLYIPICNQISLFELWNISPEINFCYNALFWILSPSRFTFQHQSVPTVRI